MQNVAFYNTKLAFSLPGAGACVQKIGRGAHDVPFYNAKLAFSPPGAGACVQKIGRGAHGPERSQRATLCAAVLPGPSGQRGFWESFHEQPRHVAVCGSSGLNQRLRTHTWNDHFKSEQPRSKLFTNACARCLSINQAIIQRRRPPMLP